MHDVLDALLDLGEGDGLGAVEEHPYDGVHAAEHLGQHLVLVGQRQPGGHVLGEGVEPLVGRCLVPGKEQALAPCSQGRRAALTGAGTAETAHPGEAGGGGYVLPPRVSFLCH